MVDGFQCIGLVRFILEVQQRTFSFAESCRSSTTDRTDPITARTP